MEMKKICLILLVLIGVTNAQAQTVSYVNQAGNLIVEEQAFLPVGFYCEYMYFPAYPDLAQQMYDGGFNTIVSETAVPDTTSYKVFLNECEMLGIKNIIVLPRHSQDSLRFKNYVEVLKPYPSLIAWTLLFNANYHEISELKLQKQKLLKLDSSRVSIADFDRIHPPFQYMLNYLEATLFYQGPWGYPWGITPDLDLVAYRYRFHAKTTDTNGLFPMVIAQTHTWEDYSFPPPAHLDCQSYLGFITGNKGVLFYDFTDESTTINISQPELYAAATNVATEILQSELKQVILHGQHQYQNINQYRHYATWRYNNAFYVIALNASPYNSYYYDIPLPEDVNDEAINFFNYRPDSLSVQNGLLSGDLAPYQVAIYKIEELPKGITNRETAAKIRVYPNPASGEIFITGTDPTLNCKIYNATGVCVAALSGISGDAPVNIRHLPDGMYFIHLYGNDKNTYQPIKIIKN
jgi:hypothetical protein